MFSIKHFLIVNDDGIHAEGVHILANVLSQYGHVTMVVPEVDRSGFGHSLSARQALRVKLHQELNHLTIYSTSGTPVDCVKVGLDCLVDHPVDLMISGVNHGSNTGQALYTSGTIGAAREACLLGYPAVSLSMPRQANQSIHQANLKSLLEGILPLLIKYPYESNHFLNINLPNQSFDDVQGIKILPMDTSNQRFLAQSDQDPRGRTIYWLNKLEGNKDAEKLWLNQDYIVISPLEVSQVETRLHESTQSWFNQHVKWTKY